MTKNFTILVSTLGSSTGTIGRLIKPNTQASCPVKATRGPELASSFLMSMPICWKVERNEMSQELPMSTNRLLSTESSIFVVITTPSSCGSLPDQL